MTENLEATALSVKMKRKCRNIITVLNVFLASSVFSHAFANHIESAHERNSQRSFPHSQILSPYLAIGAGFGGDEIGRFADSNGVVDSIHSGGGLLFEAGLSLAVDPSTSLRLSSGYQIDATSRVNGDSVFDRIRFDLTMLRRFNAHEIGVGLTTHTSVGYSCSINSICEGDVDFDHAFGYTLEYAVKVGNYGNYRGRAGSSRGLSLGVRYTGIDYLARLSGSAEVTSGDTLLGFIGVVF